MSDSLGVTPIQTRYLYIKEVADGTFKLINMLMFPSLQTFENITYVQSDFVLKNTPLRLILLKIIPGFSNTES